MKTLLIIRHAERPTIEDGTVGNELSLTSNGIHETKRLAKSLPREILSIESSPIQRCIQTAELIAEHHELPLTSIGRSNLLGDPGFIIDDAELAWTNWVERGPEAVNEHLLKGISTWPGFRDLDEAVDQMRRSIEATLAESDDGIHVWVTHDTIVATLASRLQKTPLTLKEWPDYLGGLRIQLREEDGLEISYSSSGLAQQDI
ncbi:histidine phosphatase family protein [Marinobacter alkaliphilus]|uniref:Histidine phosphatase family protein n=1 Tax=Marinobacter alkaliphilus TaxID=254719 RepID=A0ABZ3DYE6_9GAMM|tara:strand:- start:7355 stop:7963 length:609 start_codon:yes stop_codon:yes gene_type:complete